MILDEIIKREEAKLEEYRSPYSALDRQAKANIDYQSLLVEHLKTYKKIRESGDCNTCAIKNTCEYRPPLGTLVRYNCPRYERKTSDSDLVTRESVKEYIAKWKGYLDDDMIARMQMRICDIPAVYDRLPLSDENILAVGVGKGGCRKE